MCTIRTTAPSRGDLAPWFTIEPGIYIAEEKIGVRIEDTYYVDGNGKLVDFIASLPHTADEVEAAMRGGRNGTQIPSGNDNKAR